MAFNNTGTTYTISPNTSMRIDWLYFWWCWYGDCGAYYVSAHPLNPYAKLVMSEQSKAQWGPYYYYGVTVTNTGPYATNFILQGGGFA